MNVVRWSDGSKAYFQNISNCSDFANLVYGCSGGFVTISSPMGTRVCEIYGVRWRRPAPNAGGSASYETRSCRYK